VEVTAMVAVQSKVRTFLATRLPREIGEEEDIFALGFVNSLFALQLVLFIEQEFGITVESEDLELDNFRTLVAISNLVDRKVG
jgi:methoxymalonate biosynthesis acyl carrier protein